MSTRSNIGIRLREEDKNRDLNFHPGCVINTNKNYISVYCHFDGYPSHMLTELENHFNTYEKALELVLHGDISSIEDGVVDCYYDRGEDWEDLCPFETNNSNDCFDNSYCYIFENNKWTVL